MCAHVHTLLFEAAVRGGGTSCINTTRGKRPSYGCHGKYGPLSCASSPFLPLLSPFSSTALYYSSNRPPFAFISTISTASSFPDSTFFLLYFTLPPLLFSLPPSPIFPSRHSGLPTGSRRALNAAQNEATFNASWQADWGRHNIVPQL